MNSADDVRPASLLEESVEGVGSRDQPLSPSDASAEKVAQQKAFTAAMEYEIPFAQALKADEYKQLQARNVAAAERSQEQQAFEAARANQLEREQISQEKQWKRKKLEHEANINKLHNQKADALRNRELAARKANVAESFALEAKQLREKEQAETLRAIRKAEFAMSAKEAQWKEDNFKQLQKRQSDTAKRRERQQDAAAAEEEELLKQTGSQKEQLERMNALQADKLESLQMEKASALDRKNEAAKEAEDAALAASQAKSRKQQAKADVEGAAADAASSLNFTGVPISEWPAKVAAAESSMKKAEKSAAQSARFKQVQDNQKAAQDRSRDREAVEESAASELVRMKAARAGTWKAQRDLKEAEIKELQDETVDASYRKSNAKNEAQAAKVMASTMNQQGRKEATLVREAEYAAAWQAQMGGDVAAL
jgi:hypothetical protein